MRSFEIVILALCVCSSAALADPTTESTDEREEKAIRECNVTNPVSREPANLLVQSIITGDTIDLSQEEKCHLYCFLQKVRFFDENGNIRGTGLVNYTLKEAPKLDKHIDVLIVQIFQIIRTTKGIQDKCSKAVITFHQYLTNLFTLTLADGLQNFADVKGKIASIVEGGKYIPTDLEIQVKYFLNLVNSLFKEATNSTLREIFASNSTRPSTSSTTLLPPVPSPASAPAPAKPVK